MSAKKVPLSSWKFRIDGLRKAGAEVSPYLMNRIDPTANTGTASWLRFKIAALLVLILIHMLVTFLALVPGYLNVDEGIYHWMVRTYSTRGTLELWNGWADAPAREFGHRFLKVHDGKLFPQYPYLFAVLACPFYRLAGLSGLFLLNSAAFVGVVLLCFAAARRIFQDVNLALDACFILILATFAWEYSQAAWPHSTALLFGMGSFYLVACSYCAGSHSTAGEQTAARCLGSDVTEGEYRNELESPSTDSTIAKRMSDHSARRSSSAIVWRKAWEQYLPALGGGIVAGFAPGVRLDQFLMFPCLVAPFLFSRPWRPVEGFLVLLGAIPGVLVLAATNLAKFGVFDPFLYGVDPAAPSAPSFSIIVGALALLFVVWLLTRQRFDGFVRTHRIHIYAVAAATCLIVIFLAPHVLSPLEQMVKNLYVSVLDIRALDPNVAVSGIHRTESGGVVSGGGLRKALLQSMPFLVILLFPIVNIVRGSEDAPVLAMLLLVPITCVGYYSYSFFELMGGGLSLNLRYYVMCLPFVSILTAYALRELDRSCPASTGTMLAAAIIAASIFFLFRFYLAVPLTQMELVVLVVPLALAGSLLALLAANKAMDIKRVSQLRKPLWAVVTVAIVWAGLIALFYDYPMHRRWRDVHQDYAEQLLSVIPPDSVVFADVSSLTPSLYLIEKDRVRIGILAQDFPGLVDFNLKEGRRVFGFFNVGLWGRLEPELARVFTTDPLITFPAYSVKELSRASDSRGPE